MTKSNTATILHMKSVSMDEDATISIAELLNDYRKLNEKCDQVLEKIAKRSQGK